MVSVVTKQNIPNGWHGVSVEDICTVLRGQGLSKDKIDPMGTNKCLLYGELFTTYNEVISNVKSKTNADEGVRSVDGDILIPGSTTTIARDLAIASSLRESNVLVGGDVNILRKKDVNSYDSNFLAYYLTHFRKNEMSRVAQGTTIIHLYGSGIKNIELIIPKKIEEQKKIVEILETVDGEIEKTDDVVAATEKLKRGLMQQLFIRGIGHTKFKNTKLGEIPEDWRVLRLKDIAKYRRGSFPQPYGLSKWYDDIDGAPFTQVFDVGEDMRLKDKTKRSISKAAQEMSVFVKKGSLILTIQGSIGRVAITQYDTYLDRTLLLFESFLVPIDLPFFSYAMSILFNREKERAPGGIIKTITKEALSSFLVPTPDLPEQKRISDILSSIDEKISINQKLKDRLILLKKGLVQDLLSGKKRTV